MDAKRLSFTLINAIKLCVVVVRQVLQWIGTLFAKLESCSYPAKTFKSLKYSLTESVNAQYAS